MIIDDPKCSRPKTHPNDNALESLLKRPDR